MPSAKNTTKCTDRRRVRGDARRVRSRKEVKRGMVDCVKARDPTRTARVPRAPPRARAVETDGLTSHEISARRTLLLVRGADNEGAARGGRGAHLGGTGGDARLRGEERGGVGDGRHVVPRVEETDSTGSASEEVSSLAAECSTSLFSCYRNRNFQDCDPILKNSKWVSMPRGAAHTQHSAAPLNPRKTLGRRTENKARRPPKFEPPPITTRRALRDAFPGALFRRGDPSPRVRRW